MGNGKHTPGPWAVKSGSVWTKHSCYEDATQFARIAYMDRDCPHTRPTERDANARLIAAAPELLEALEKIATWPDGFTFIDAIELASAAIAKAKGE